MLPVYVSRPRNVIKEYQRRASCVRATVGEDRQPAVRMPNDDMVALSKASDNSATNRCKHKVSVHKFTSIYFFKTSSKTSSTLATKDTHLTGDRAILAATNTAVDAASKDIAEKR